MHSECEPADSQVADADTCTGTIRIGVALTDHGQRDYDKVIARTDKALMRAKRERRNRVVLAE